MGVYIYEGSALTKMAMVEGADWAREQAARPTNAHGFFAYLNEWKMIQDELEPGEVWEDNLCTDGGDSAIYGKEGYSRYIVRGDGEIVLLSWSAREEVQSRARRAGFRVA